jgi:uncharacterized protein YacL
MTPEFISRLVGLLVFAVVGARLGAQTAEFLNLNIESRAFIFGLTGMLFGLIATPWFTVRPIVFLRQVINEMPVERLITSLVGLSIGLTLSLLAAYPLSLLDEPFGTLLPSIAMLVFGYLAMTIFGVRHREILDAVGSRLGRTTAASRMMGQRKLLLDTSALIDGRIVDVADTGFLGGSLIVPRFVLAELHRVADSSDLLRRNRGRRGLNMLNKLQRNDLVPVRIIDDDIDDISEVDNKLVALALQISAALVTNDYNLGEVAAAQGISVLNINRLANAVRAIYIPGETFAIRIIQEGKDPDQGIGYLDDGTMVVVENGKDYLDRSIKVEVTKLITRETGRMIFAVPQSEVRRRNVVG